MSEVKVNKISPRTNCGTVQLGDSGDTITIPSGATITNNGTQTGFGRTGTVDWQTSIKTAASFTAVNGEGYFVDTSSNAVTANLPAGSVGAIVSFKDYAQNFDTNALTIAANGSEKIEGQTFDLIINTEGAAVTLVYGDATKGWQAVNSNEITNSEKFVTATGGTVTCSGNFKIHTFTGPGTFCVSCAGNPAGSTTVDYVVVAGGAGGGGNEGGGGGGAGGFREAIGNAPDYTASPLASSTALPVTATAFPITVGAGGSAGPRNSGDHRGGCGTNSVFSTITSAGGGGGGGGSDTSSHRPGNNGGSGGGGGETRGGPGQQGTGGTGNTPPVSPAQGRDGGDGNANTGNPAGAGGGGGAGCNGAGGNPSGGGAGGPGVTSSITASPVTRAGGGGGGVYGPAPLGGGGPGGGGDGGRGTPCSGAVAGTANTGGGGGGAGQAPKCGAAGGSGIVIIRYKFQ
jgi:hypothetical protein